MSTRLVNATHTHSAPRSVMAAPLAFAIRPYDRRAHRIDAITLLAEAFGDTADGLRHHAAMERSIDYGYVASTDERVVGVLFVQRGSKYSRRDHGMHVRALCVSTRHQSRGIGSALMGAALTDPQARAPVSLVVDRTWDAANTERRLQFYKRLGFHVVHDLSDIFDLRRMHLPVNARMVLRSHVKSRRALS